MYKAICQADKAKSNRQQDLQIMLELSLMRQDTDIQNISFPLINLWEMWLQACAVFIRLTSILEMKGIYDVEYMYLQKTHILETNDIIFH